MKEQLITFETAKLAKEKQFEESVSNAYTKEGNLWKGNDKRVYLAPTQSLLQKWLREVHNIHVNPQPYHESADHTNDITGYYMGDIEHGARGKVLWIGDDNYSTYEEALEAGLLKALKEINK